MESNSKNKIENKSIRHVDAASKYLFQKCFRLFMNFPKDEVLKELNKIKVYKHFENKVLYSSLKHDSVVLHSGGLY